MIAGIERFLTAISAHQSPLCSIRFTANIPSQEAPDRVGPAQALDLTRHDIEISAVLNLGAPLFRVNPVHPGGEEILMLEGVFRDEDGVYPASGWLRNPRWSLHTPRSTAGRGADLRESGRH